MKLKKQVTTELFPKQIQCFLIYLLVELKLYSKVISV